MSVIRPSESSARGFTLMEVLVATAILAILATSVYGVLWRSLEGKLRAEDRAELFAAGREAVMRMADDLERALPPTAGSNNSVWFIGVPGQGAVPNDAVGLVAEIRRDQTVGSRRGGRAIVSFQLEPVPEVPNTFALVRREELVPDPLGQMMADPTAQDPSAGGLPMAMDTFLLDRVAGLRFRYLDPESGGWVNAWDTTILPPPVPGMVGQPPPIGLPPIVEIQLFVYDSQGAYVDFSTRVDLPLFTVPPTPAMPGQAPPAGSE